MNYNQTFFVKPSPHEIVQTTVSLAADQRPALIGTVIGTDDKPVDAALVTIYRADAPHTPIGALYTDDVGQFAFGPLSPGQLYQVKVFKAGDNIRELEQG